MTTATPHEKPRVTLCVPVAPGAPGLTETLEAIHAQTFEDFCVTLSLDGADEAAETLCKAAAEDPKIKYSVRPDAVGRIGNLNHLLFHAGTEFVCVLPEGGLPGPDWLGHLIAALDSAPGAVLAAGGSAPVAMGRDPAQRVLAVMSGVDVGTRLQGLIRTSALSESGRLSSSAANDVGAEAAFIAQLALQGALVAVPKAETETQSAPVQPPQGDAIETWTLHCADMAGIALITPASAQELRLLWLAVLARLLSPVLSRPVLEEALSSTRRDALIDGFLQRMEQSDTVNVPFLLDGDWERIKRWSKGFCWVPRDREMLVDFGPQPVNAGQKFNVQPGGKSAVWMKTEGRLAPGTRIRFAGQLLETTLELNMATGVVPSSLTAKSGEYPLVLVDADGNLRSNEVTFWVLRATALGRSVVRMLRRMRGLPDPAALKALPPPSA